LSVLLLQGPLGPFFQHFAQALMDKGVDVHKIHFNPGDAYYYRLNNATNYKGESHYWSLFLKDFLIKHGVKMVIVYGDCRYYHQCAKQLCQELGIRYLALEEGYLRPN